MEALIKACRQNCHKITDLGFLYTIKQLFMI